MLKFAFLSKIIRDLLDINTKALYICIIRKQQNNINHDKFINKLRGRKSYGNDLTVQVISRTKKTVNY